MPTPLIEADRLTVEFPQGSSLPFAPKRMLRAVDNVNFELLPGEILGVVGESGSGKSTLARALLHLIRPQAGTVTWMGNDIAEFDRHEIRKLRRNAQIIFQDPSASLNPRMTVGEIIGEPLKNFERRLTKADHNTRISETMAQVGLSPQLVNRYPHEISGGQCQRVCIARAMIVQPRLLVCDEPVSALDVSVQAQIVSLLRKLQREFELSLIFISHDLAIVRHLCHRILVFYMGRIVESGTCESLFARPRHPYTQALIRSAPVPDPQIARARHRAVVPGEPPSPLRPPSGCHYHTRCPKASSTCIEQAPRLEGVSQGHRVSCHHPLDHGK